MEKLHYSIEISAPRQKVWDYMLGDDTYEKWAQAAWPGSTCEGDWTEGTEMRFAGPGGGGTLARITAVEAPHKLAAEHIAVLQDGGGLDTTSDIAREWIGAREDYELQENNGHTVVNVWLTVAAAWRDEFDSS